MRKRIPLRAILTGFLWIIAFQICRAEINEDQFYEVTGASGIIYSGQSYGVAWEDSNDDGWPDLYVTNHSTPPALYLNQGDGTFEDIAAAVMPSLIGVDTHGAAWADFDNDGDMDLLVIVGGGRGIGSGSNRLFVNDGGTFHNEAPEMGIDFPLGRGHAPLWLDWNRDGRLDVVLCNYEREDALTRLFMQTITGFEDVSVDTGFDISKTADFAQLLGLPDNLPLLLMHGSSYPQRVYDMEAVPFEDVTEVLGLTLTGGVRDVAIADLDGDLALDLLLMRGRGGPDAVQLDSVTVHAKLNAGNEELGIGFKSAGDVRFDFYPRLNVTELWQPANIFIGSQGQHPADVPFTLNADDPAVRGIAEHIPGAEPGIYIGYDDAESLWQVWESHPSGYELYILVESSEPISDLDAYGFTFPPAPLPDHLVVYGDGGFEDRTGQSGLDANSLCGNVVAADFDNDMDVDLYTVCSRPIINLPNMLYENRGDGTFLPVPEAGGAAGTTVWIGSSVTAADYDCDGFIDLFVTNGVGNPGLPFGPSQLYRNQGNENHWIEIDLEGVVSNRDGIQARLLLTAGGVTQVRQQAGAMHARSQNHKRVHFGLGANQKVDRLLVDWPSGIRQELTGIPADEVIRVVEPSHPSVRGRPDFTPGQSSGVFLWKETFDGPYHLRTSGNGPKAVYEVAILADRPLTSVVPVRLEPNDQLLWEENHLNFTSRLTAGQDGIDFGLPAGTAALISVSVDGQPNPRVLHVGSAGLPVSPAGWVLGTDQLSEMPNFEPAADLGLFVGLGALPDEIQARWNGDGYRHTAVLKIISSQILQKVEPVSFEPCCDSLTVADRSLSVTAATSSWWDGLNILVMPDSVIGIRYYQDGIFQPHRVNGKTRNLGLANACDLPLSAVFGQPAYDPAQDKGLFIWQSEDGVWHLKCTAGGNFGRYQGQIISSLPVLSVTGVGLEPQDVLTLSPDQRQIEFDLRMWNRALDGFDFALAEGSQVVLNLNDNTAEAAGLVQVGAERWPLEKLPAVITE